MKIVLFSDVHANLPAMEAAFQSIDNLKADAVYCLGDLVGYNVWPNEVIHEIRKRRIPTIAGNHDAKVKKLSEIKLEEFEKNYAYRIIGHEQKKFLGTLPAHLRIEFQLKEQRLILMMVHGSPTSNQEYLLEDKGEDDFLTVFRNAGTHVLCFGHSHKPYHRILRENIDNVVHYRHAINTGSVGKPKDGNPQGGYVILNIDDTSSMLLEESIRVEFVRFDYEIETAAQAVENSPLPNEFAEMLRKAY